MNEDFPRITHEDLLRDPDLIDRVQREARRYRAREVGRTLRAAWHSVTQSGQARRRPLRTASCG